MKMIQTDILSYHLDSSYRHSIYTPLSSTAEVSQQLLCCRTSINLSALEHLQDRRTNVCRERHLDVGGARYVFEYVTQDDSRKLQDIDT
jgi:hypothetical protein